ncbi:lipocalin family protein [Paracraurococcus lichenis]|uniref:Outer membrane lipoprotein Blc n=1 Tax=Paracraurococcus lichenis TaxID=3064888 RepID=A0ABT9DWX0_9PROT|nr:lipocalin family protein [Paracraurococcus sp. LOR1-02]MDO9708396.1 lipocalin family protein [Paracraurococcus sp. LOR1-02]
MRGFALAAALLLAGCVSQPDATTPQPVAGVEVQRYLGTWLEVARLPMWAQDSSSVSCEDVTATYTLRPDGRIGVVNRCLNVLDGDRPRQAEGQAYAVEGSHNARLRVSFFWPFFGNYWVIGLDPDYRWAVVGEPSRRWLWVLSRTPKLDPAELDKALGIARANGYDLSTLKVARLQKG